MLLRFLFKLLNPYNNGRKSPRRKSSFWSRLRFKVYDVLIKVMKGCYRRYAFSDVVEVGQVRVVQDLRDLEFELWMEQAGIEIKQHLSTSRMPKAKKKIFGCRPLYSFFHFRHQLTVFSDEKSLTIDRTHNLLFENSLVGQLSLSDANDIISSTCFKTICDNKPDGTNQHSESPSHNPDGTRKNKKAKGHKHLGQSEKPQNQEMPQQRRKVTLNPGGTIAPPESDSPSKPVQPSTIPTRKLQGVEVDESF